MQNRDKVRLFSIWREWKGLVIFLLLMVCFRSAIADWNVVPSGSMKPTIVEGDRIFVNKLAYDLKVPFSRISLARWNDPVRGDVVVFYSPADGERLVKRVIGLPGDTIALRDNRLWINGEALEYARPDPAVGEESPNHVYLIENLAAEAHPVLIGMKYGSSLRSFGPVTVPPGRYFMLGDNRDNSADSRVFGFVDRKLIVGRTRLVVLSLNAGNYYLPRSDRFFYCLP